MLSYLSPNKQNVCNGQSTNFQIRDNGRKVNFRSNTKFLILLAPLLTKSAASGDTLVDYWLDRHVVVMCVRVMVAY